MANTWGYNQQFTDKPEMWTSDGYALCTDGYGTLAIITNIINTKGSLVASQSNAPSAVVNDITRIGVGQYRIHLKQTWVQLEYADVKTVLDPGLATKFIGVQLQDVTVGSTAFGPGQAELQYLQLLCNVGGVATEIPLNGAIMFQLRLKNSSA